MTARAAAPASGQPRRESLTAGLPALERALDWGLDSDDADRAAASYTAEQRQYLRFYQLEFGTEYPAARHAMGYLASAGQRLAVHLWRQPQARATLLLVHGYFDHVGLMRHLIHFGLARGCNVVAFDLPGHGLSTGAPASIADFGDYQQAVSDVRTALDSLGERWYVIAQSTGAAAVMDYLTRPDRAALFARVALLAPLVRPQGWLWVRAAHTLLCWWLPRLPRFYPQNSNDAAFCRFLRQDPLQADFIAVPWVGALRRWLPEFLRRAPVLTPLLVLQGDADTTVDWRYNLERIRQLFPAVDIHMLPGARHHLANESEALRGSYYPLLADYLALPPARE